MALCPAAHTDLRRPQLQPESPNEVVHLTTIQFPFTGYVRVHSGLQW